MAIIIRRLQEDDEVETFDCGDEPLNNYLKRHAWTNQEKSLIGVTYVARRKLGHALISDAFRVSLSSDRERVPMHNHRRLSRPSRLVRTIRLYSD